MNKTEINDLKEEAMVERLEKGWQEAALAYDIGTPFGAFSIAMDELKTAIAHIRQQEARIAELDAERQVPEDCVVVRRNDMERFRKVLAYGAHPHRSPHAADIDAILSQPHPPADQTEQEPRHE